MKLSRLTKFIALGVILPHLLIPSQSSIAEEAVMPEPATFHGRLDQAKHFVEVGDFARANWLFEKLIETHPGEWIVYDFYAQTLGFRQKFDRAIQIYNQALIVAEKIKPQRADEILERIEILEEKKAFSERMKKEKPWRDAAVFGSQEFIIKTNIPQEDYVYLAQNLGDLIEEEREILTEILGAPKATPAAMKIFIVGNAEDYEALMDEREREGKRRFRLFHKAFYVPLYQEMFIYYDGGADWYKIAHEMVHHLLCNLYIEEPSAWLNEGLAEYVAYRLEKSSAGWLLESNLEFMNWLYDQGRWEYAMDVFYHWDPRLAISGPQTLIERFQGYPKNGASAHVFYMMAWTLVSFFIDADDEFFSDFFRGYLAYERDRQQNNYHTAFEYFHDNLTAKQIEDLDNRWGRFCLSLTYEEI